MVQLKKELGIVYDVVFIFSLLALTWVVLSAITPFFFGNCGPYFGWTIMASFILPVVLVWVSMLDWSFEQLRCLRPVFVIAYLIEAAIYLIAVKITIFTMFEQQKCMSWKLLLWVCLILVGGMSTAIFPLTMMTHKYIWAKN